MPYEIVMCKVTSVDLEKRLVQLNPLTSPHIGKIEVEVGSGLKFVSEYAPYVSLVDTKSNKINNVPTGRVAYPNHGDLVLALVWLTDLSSDGSVYPIIGQNQTVEVIILGRVHWKYPSLSPYDNMILDQSGAKLHFNHGWLDDTNVDELPPEYIDKGDKSRQYHKLTGHLTLVGNRFVTLSGIKFLAFGLLSHLLNRNKVKDPIVFPASTEDPDDKVGTEWTSVFTQDPTANIHESLMDVGLTSGMKFLQPPCPDPGEKMDMHDSGWKVLVGTDGHERNYIPKGKIIIVGHNNNDNIKRSFDPVGIGESGTYANVATGVIKIYLVNGSDNATITIDPAAANKISIVGKVYITGDLEVTGEVKGATGTFGS